MLLTLQTFLLANKFGFSQPMSFVKIRTDQRPSVACLVFLQQSLGHAFLARHGVCKVATLFYRRILDITVNLSSSELARLIVLNEQGLPQAVDVFRQVEDYDHSHYIRVALVIARLWGSVAQVAATVAESVV